MEGRQTEIFAMPVEEEVYGGPQTVFSNEVSKNLRQIQYGYERAMRPHSSPASGILATNVQQGLFQRTANLLTIECESAI